MDLSNLKPAAGSVKTQGKRLGRGQGSGKGGTSTKGHKGQKAISGYSKKIGFEGGQMPLQRRLPKFGFKNKFRKEYKAVNLDTLEAFAEKTGIVAIDVETLVNAGLAPKNSLVKVLGNGTLTKKLDVKAHAFSNSAKTAIEALQGTTAVIQ
ncbi:MAG: 50S ribosomal protein L15 [Bacteroidales bacterium]|jgi:large subunit ribosomal protein L15|nr:50S ribosomal protein L15 [Bacteroidales bacterium]